MRVWLRPESERSARRAGRRHGHGFDGDHVGLPILND